MEPAAQQRDDGRIHAIPRSVSGVPQWSPPLSRGMTPACPPGNVRRITAAMEPAAQQRDDFADWREKRDAARPQWSPPLSSGMTAANFPGTEHVTGAAMEPAAQQRDDQAVTPGIVAQYLAAMEPAAQQRDDVADRRASGAAGCCRNGARRSAAG